MNSKRAAADLPSFDELGYAKDQLIDALKNEVRLPSREVAIATVYAGEIEQDVIVCLERASREDLDRPSGRLLFRGLHILGGRRFTAGYRPLIDFLRGPQDRVEDVLGDAITETLPRILAGIYNGDVAPLLALIADGDVDEFVREAALKTFAFLTFDKRIAKNVAEDYLVRFERENSAPPGDMTWHGWMTAVALLGLEQLSPRVHAAFHDGRISCEVAHEQDYAGLLRAAVTDPQNPKRFEDEHLGYIEDVLASLEPFWEGGSEQIFEEDSEQSSEENGPESDWLPYEYRVPAHNPWRGIGRNDPCPCGSGKKAKRCCMP